MGWGSNKHGERAREGTKEEKDSRRK